MPAVHGRTVMDVRFVIREYSKHYGMSAKKVHKTSHMFSAFYVQLDGD